jgi:GNAT superfamily N-acetyltransferase
MHEPGSRDCRPDSRNYRVERLGSDNLKDLDALYTAVYGHASHEQFFPAKYDTVYTGAAYLGYFAYNGENTAIAYFGVIPCFLEYAGRLILAAQSVDGMTHPDYRNRGLFLELVRLTIDLCRKEKVSLLFGFPNQQSQPAFINRLGWTQIERMECFSIPIKTIPLASLSRRLPAIRRIFSGYTRAVLKKYILPRQGLPCSAMSGDSGGLYRDEAYFRYKTYSLTWVIRAGKANVWMKIDNSLVIGDIELNGQDIDRTIGELKKIAVRLGLRKMYFHSSPGSSLHRLFAARYPVIPSFPVIFLDLRAEIPLDKLKFTFADIDTF